jgi:hypothetical protein
MTTKRHHTVSRGYQRFFGKGERGERLHYIDKQAGTFAEVGTSNIFVAPHFNSWLSPSGWDTHLEHEWQRVEDQVLPLVRRINMGIAGTVEREAAVILAAMHFARSEAYLVMHRKLGEQTVLKTSTKWADDAHLVELFIRDIGHPPAPGEIEAYFSKHWEAMTQDRSLFLQSMVRAYDFAREHLSKQQLQLMWAKPPFGFVTSDTPLLYSDETYLKLGIRGGLALGDSTRLFMPLGTHVAFTLWGEDAPPDVVISRREVQTCNLLMWRNAGRFLACHPDLDLGRVLPGCSLTPRTSEVLKRATKPGS